MKNWIKEYGWLVLMLLGSSLLFWTVSSGSEGFIGQIPIACMLIIIGVSINSANN